MNILPLVELFYNLNLLNRPTAPHPTSASRTTQTTQKTDAVAKATSHTSSGAAQPVKYLPLPISAEVLKYLRDMLQVKREVVKEAVAAPVDSLKTLAVVTKEMAARFEIVRSIPGLDTLMRSSTAEEQTELLKFLVAHCPNLRSLKLPAPSDELLDLVAPMKGTVRTAAFPNLSRLQLGVISSKRSTLTHSTLATVLEALLYVQEVRLEGVIIKRKKEDAPFKPLAKSLHTLECIMTTVTDADITQLTQGIRLKTLSVAYNEVTGSCFATISPFLETLYCVETPLTDEALKGLKGKNHLVLLYIHGNGREELTGLYLNELSTSLEKLVLWDCRNITSETIQKLQATRPKLELEIVE